ncbi:MAG: hypothetical protein JJ892_14150 [Balneola sp.]|nr:hypothetical protein [Balneola sp.]MBO6649871.1 hypothetical protein [Balneola sp.]MBO6712435.1 hypothetical protein [Balneola sp.]MBO6801414.1 hypothetical protein [Balneola sp.]MBO6871772.1 hypothetical protein [Balneola sp.]
MKGLKITGIILAILLGAVLAVGMTIDGIVESGIEDSGSDLLKTEVEVDDIDISVFGSSADMDGFIVYNPEGFTEGAAISLKEIEIDLDVQSLLTDKILINKIRVKKPEIFFEQKGQEVNLRKLSSNIDAGSDADSEKTIIIKEFILEEGKVKIHSELEKERSAEASIDRLVLNNIGESGSKTIQQAMKQIMSPIIREALSEAVKSGLKDILEEKVNGLIDF